MDYGEELSVYGDFIKGTCNLMCPINERKLRERERLLHPLERLTQPESAVSSTIVSTKTNHNRNLDLADPNKIVKSFSRSAAGQKMPSPSDLRPYSILDMTVSYLILEVACNGIHSAGWADRYNFVTDRLRAVRQDMVIQNLPPRDCISLLKPMVKFHIFAAYWLSESSINVFDPKLNASFLHECIKRLLLMYNINRKKAADINKEEKEVDQKCENCENEEHMIGASYSLINSGNVEALNQAVIRLGDYNCMPCESCFEKKAFEVSLATWHGNYTKVCKILRKLPPLLVMAAAINLPSIRRHALKVMTAAYSNKTLKFPIDVLEETLMWNNKNEVVEECKYYGISVEKTDDMKFYACFQKGTFDSNVKQLQPSRLKWLDNTLNDITLSKILSNQS
ncbi:Germinal-center associated nuclear protein [Frankliniella fusca]|uniref:Germinal-center associated nuclear protein n=1 Tax=Frankliniella fusca TaxID=407009 RepID=A0AAE1HW56_9NEOP|nr:Germinal-center associated nuclear protein [Frankliniella fusca]